MIFCANVPPVTLFAWEGEDMDSTIIAAIIGAIGVIIATIIGVMFQKRQKTEQPSGKQKSKGAIASPQIQTDGNVSIGEIKVEVHGDLNKGK
jgi:H+/gluconate symporter-like permease